MTGVDASAELIAQAKRDLPAASFVVADVRQFQSTGQFDGALSTFDSLNHILELTDLEASFRNVHRALLAGAPFVFDMNSEQAYRMDWQEWSTRRYTDQREPRQGPIRSGDATSSDRNRLVPADAGRTVGTPR